MGKLYTQYLSKNKYLYSGGGGCGEKNMKKYSVKKEYEV